MSIEADDSARARIMAATIELLRETGDPGAVTVRRIAERAGVGLGLMNYHFRSKDELVDESVRAAIADVIRRWGDRVPPTGLPPRLRLERMLGAAADFLAEHRQLSTISIQFDQRAPRPEDNTAATLAGLLPVLRELAGADTPEPVLRTLAVQLVAPIQFAFLRGPAARALVGWEFDQEADRTAFVRQLVEGLFPADGGKR